MNVYEFAAALLHDEEFNGGGIIKNERMFLDSIGFEYTVKDGAICDAGEDLRAFYEAMETIRQLNLKYKK